MPVASCPLLVAWNKHKAEEAKMRSFEDLEVYKKARELTNGICKITREGIFSRDRLLVAQIRAAASSIMSNIAEGFERGTNAEFVQFLFIAKGSCAEVYSQLTIALDQNYIDASNHRLLSGLCRAISPMLMGLIKYLKKSNMRERDKLDNFLPATGNRQPATKTTRS